MRDNLSDGEDHVTRVALLPDRPVDGERDRDRLRVGDFVGRHEPRAKRPERVEALALDPLAAAVCLPVALRDVIGQTVACNMRKGVCQTDAPRFGPDDKGELRLPVPLSQPWGATTSSSGPWMQVMALLNTSGSFGIGIPDSAACLR